MKIIYNEICEDTGQRLNWLMPRKLYNKKIFLNLGDSKHNCEQRKGYKGYRFINKVKAVKRCVNKVESLKILKKNGVSVAKFYDIKNKNPLLFIYLLVRYLMWGKKLFLKGRHSFEILNFKKFFELLYKMEKYLYFSVIEKKTQEYRVLVYKGRVFRIMEKTANGKKFAWKNEVCKFKEIPKYWHWCEFVGIMKKECMKASLSLGIDLCGIDIIRTKDNKLKILEVNSAMGMGKPTIRRFYKVLMEELKTGWVSMHTK